MAKRKTRRKRSYTRASYSPSRPAKRRYKPARRRSGLSASLGMGNIKSSVMITAKGAIGGILNTFIGKLIDKDGTKPDNRLFAGIGLSIIAGMFLKQPAIAAGIAGSIGTPIGQKLGFLKDDMEYVPDSLLSQRALTNQPMFINDQNGNNYQLAENGEYLPINQFGLNDNGNFNQIYPGYNNPGFY